MRIVCQQTILMKYHALFVIFEKNSKISNCRLLQNIVRALMVNWQPYISAECTIVCDMVSMCGDSTTVFYSESVVQVYTCSGTVPRFDSGPKAL